MLLLLFHSIIIIFFYISVDAKTKMNRKTSTAKHVRELKSAHKKSECECDCARLILYITNKMKEVKQERKKKHNQIQTLNWQ